MDKVLARITFDPGVKPLPKIAWPAGLAPKPFPPLQPGTLPLADVLVVTWTAAEVRALADVLTPGVQSTDWTHYDTNFAAYESQLTGRSPARSEHRLGSWHLTQIGPSKVICFKSELHPATDGPTLPTMQLIAQVAKEAGVGYVITTGTAGGAGDGTALGDVNVASHIRADFTTRLKDRSFSSGTWQTARTTPSQAGLLDMVGTLAPDGPYQHAHPPAMWYGDVVSTDFFAFDTADDHFGLRSYDPEIRAVEMDDAAVALGAALASVPVASVRNASDPVMPDDTPATARQASDIYEKYGYYTTINSAIATWAMIAGLPGETAS